MRAFLPALSRDLVHQEVLQVLPCPNNSLEVINYATIYAMSIDNLTPTEAILGIPERLHPRGESMLPTLDFEVLARLGELGWKRVGLMVAFVDEEGALMIIEHNKTDKNNQGDLGPLGETTKGQEPYIEQPNETLFRGIREELGVVQPQTLDLSMPRGGKWTVNQWPCGRDYPGDFACAISFPVFIGDPAKERLLSRRVGTDETCGIQFMLPSTIFDTDDSVLRPGVKPWLQQMIDTNLLACPAEDQLQALDFTNLFPSALHDIELS